MNQPFRILIVEDEMLIAMMLEDMLADLGHRTVGPMHTLDTALSAVETQDFDLAILDVNLGSKSSVPVAEALAERSIPFVFATGHSAAHLDSRFADRPVVGKPFDERSLAAAIEAAAA